MRKHDRPVQSEGNPMTAPSDSNKIVVGYTTQTHLLVDLDNCSWVKAQAAAKLIMHSYRMVGDCLIVESSPAHYHLVFDDRLEWDTIVHIIEVIADLQLVQENFRQVRTFRRDITLRVSDKIGAVRYHAIPQPKLILQTGHMCDGFHGIRQYLDILNAFNPVPYDLIPK